MKFYALSSLILLLAVSNLFAQQKETPKPASDEIINDKAISLPEPVYPSAARAVMAYGAVRVQVTIDENGDVTSAFAISGHPLLRAASTAAARQAKFVPTTIDGKTVKFTGTILFIFILPEQWQYIGEMLGDSEVEIADGAGLREVAKYLETAYPEIFRLINEIAETYQKDEQAARFQPNAIGDVIAQIRSKLDNKATSLWFFELGLTVGRIQANYFDEAVLRINLPRLRELTLTYPTTQNRTLEREEWSENIEELSNMAERQYFSRKDKLRIKKLIESF